MSLSGLGQFFEQWGSNGLPELFVGVSERNLLIVYNIWRL